VPDVLYQAMKRLGGEKFQTELVHPVDYEDDHIALVMVSDEQTYLVRFDPPDTASITFLGSLAGGRYVETVAKGEIGYNVEGAFSHPRLGDDGPLRVVVRPLPGTRSAYPGPGDQEALERTRLLVEHFRDWSREPPPAQPPAAA
jgi:hypothetical protein